MLDIIIKQYKMHVVQLKKIFLYYAEGKILKATHLHLEYRIPVEVSVVHFFRWFLDPLNTIIHF